MIELFNETIDAIKTGSFTVTQEKAIFEALNIKVYDPASKILLEKNWETDGLYWRYKHTMSRDNKWFSKEAALAYHYQAKRISKEKDFLYMEEVRRLIS